MSDVPDRRAEPVVAAAPTAETTSPSSAPVGPGPLGPGPMTPARVMAMQRSAGNAPVTAMLQRATTADLPALGGGDLAALVRPRGRRASGAAGPTAAGGGAAAGAAGAGAAVAARGAGG